ncbi:hypothetical protein [Shinella zoogloeoides]|uniref:hypothetical protein n=1 Tax=Shinella zoogloeoides TaxID=352475 RepID=UPI00299CD74D|nr:hypothetical protein [Shinella zoogloeoides]WPE19949.1 hypothetical protein ShzoTeo12_11290 [Shinella zoogloeoides]
MTQLGFRSTGRGPNAVDYEAMKKNAFHDQDILIVNIRDSKLPWQDRELLASIGERLYGRKRARVQHGGKSE